MTFLDNYPSSGIRVQPEMSVSGVSNVSSGLQQYIDFINILEGVKTRIKNMHWASKKIANSDKRGVHIYLDDLLSVIADFQDMLAESSQGIYGSMNLDSISAVPFTAGTPKELVGYIQGKTSEFYTGIPDTPSLAGIKSETEVLIKDLQKYQFLFSLTE
jgi:hypothetical protein